MNRWVMEFDVRMAKGQYVSRLWDRDARSQYLLCPDVEWPLSVDPLIWPSVFYAEIFRHPSIQLYSTIEIDPDIGGPSWRDLERMRAHYDANRVMAPDGVFIGVELWSERECEGETIPYMLPGGIQAAVWLEPTTPDRLPEGSTLLGYDVADAGLISGLTNCAYGPREVQDLAPIWGHRLNSFGLLETIEDAIAFRDLTDARVTEHAPFWIYALWRLPIP